MSSPPLYRPPRHPHAWLALFVLSQLLVAALWWQWGWRFGLPALLLSHAVMLWGTLWPHAALFGPVLNRLPTAERAVWLTIDDGPSADTQAMLDLLDAHAAKATFFLVAERAARHPQWVQAIVQRGHGIGNHSARHPQVWFWALGPRRMRSEITHAQQQLTELSGQRPRWFRAVVGMANPFVHAPLRDLGLARVGWTARGFDAVRACPQQVVARIERDLAPGAIVLLHEGAAHGRNPDTLALLLQRLQVLDYRCVLPEQLDPAKAVSAAPRSASC